MAANGIIPKERLSAYQRWELDALDSLPQRAAAAVPGAEEVERAYQTAREIGHAAGYREGAARARTEAERMQQLLAGLDRSLSEFDERLAGDLLALSLEIARQVLRQALAVRPELLLAAVREAMELLPQSRHGARLLLHPEDAALVHSHLGSELEQAHWRIQEDSNLERGGCRVETPESEVDARLSTRWEQVAISLGQDSRWLE